MADADEATKAQAAIDRQVASINKSVESFNRLTNTVIATGLAFVGFAAALRAAPGALEAFGEVMTYFSTILGSVATPVVVVFMAVVLAVAEMLRGPMLSATKLVAEWLGKNLWNSIATVVVKLQNFGDYMSIVGKFIQMGFLTIMEGISRAVAYVIDFIPGLGGASKALSDWADATGAANKEYAGEVTKLIEGIDKRNKDLAENKNPIQEFGKDFKEGFGKNLDTIMNSMDAATAKKGNVGFSGIGEISKTIQGQAFQSDMAGRTLQVQQQIRDILKEMRGDFMGPPAPAAVGP